MSKRTGVTVKDVPTDKFIKAYAEHLKVSGKIDVPQWVDLVKTSCAKELSPYNSDWYYIRAGKLYILIWWIIKTLLTPYKASIARKIYLRGGVGVGGLRKAYGSAKDNGTRRSHFQKASGAIIRSILKNLEKAGFVQVDPKGYGRNSNSTLIKHYWLLFFQIVVEEELQTKDKEISTKSPDHL